MTEKRRHSYSKLAFAEGGAKRRVVGIKSASPKTKRIAARSSRWRTVSAPSAVVSVQIRPLSDRLMRAISESLREGVGGSVA